MSKQLCRAVLSASDHVSTKSRQMEKETFNNCCGILQCRRSNGYSSFEAVTVVLASGISQQVVEYFEYCNTRGHACAVYMAWDMTMICMKLVRNFGLNYYLCHSDVN